MIQHWKRALVLPVLLNLAANAATPDAGKNVRIDNFTFSPQSLVVAKGETVTWRNDDDIPHLVVLSASGMRSPTLDNGDTFVQTFNQAGVFPYICGLHPQMKGQIEVR